MTTATVEWARARGGTLMHAWESWPDAVLAMCDHSLIHTAHVWKRGTKKCPRCERELRESQEERRP